MFFHLLSLIVYILNIAVKFKNFRTTLILLSITLILVFIFFEDIVFSFNLAPIPGSFSYGSKTLSYLINTFFNVNISHFLISSFLLGVTVFLYKFRWLEFININNKDYNESKMHYFIFGSLIYCSTFIISGNFDYRLVFLLFILPIIINHKSFYIWSLVILISFNQRLLKNMFLEINEFFGSALNFGSKIILFVFLMYNLINFFNNKIFNNYINRMLNLNN